MAVGDEENSFTLGAMPVRGQALFAGQSRSTMPTPFPPRHLARCGPSAFGWSLGLPEGLAGPGASRGVDRVPWAPGPEKNRAGGSSIHFITMPQIVP